MYDKCRGGKKKTAYHILSFEIRKSRVFENENGQGGTFFHAFRIVFRYAKAGNIILSKNRRTFRIKYQLDTVYYHAVVIVTRANIKKNGTFTTPSI